jgi:hypothetical protein
MKKTQIFRENNNMCNCNESIYDGIGWMWK